jgi:hypothetical protein
MIIYLLLNILARLGLLRRDLDYHLVVQSNQWLNRSSG